MDNFLPRSCAIAPLSVALASGACAATVIVPVSWGGDRVGLGEIRFSAVPEPHAHGLVAGLGLLGLAVGRNQSRAKPWTDAGPSEHRLHLTAREFPPM